MYTLDYLAKTACYAYSVKLFNPMSSKDMFWDSKTLEEKIAWEDSIKVVFNILNDLPNITSNLENAVTKEDVIRNVIYGERGTITGHKIIRNNTFTHTEQEIKESVSDLMIWLEQNRPEMKPYSVNYSGTYAKITSQDRSVYCFIPVKTGENKAIGHYRTGDLLKPATWAQPAKHARGYLFDKATWPNAFGEYGMTYLR